MRRNSGFTLLEVLIALVVVALALLALMRTAGGQVRAFDELRQRTLAGWVASNVLNETRLATPLPPIGRSDGRLRFGKRDWRWQLSVQATSDVELRRLEVRVYLADEQQPLATLSGFGSSLPLP